MKSSHSQSRSLHVVLVAFGLICAPAARAEEHESSLWDMKRLSKAAAVEPADSYGASDIHSVFYAGEPFNGKPTKVFAYYGFPEGASASARVPGVVCVHGDRERPSRNGSKSGISTALRQSRWIRTAPCQSRSTKTQMTFGTNGLVRGGTGL